MIRVPKKLIREIIDYIGEQTYHSPNGKAKYLHENLIERYNESKDMNNEEKIIELEEELYGIRRRLIKLELTVREQSHICFSKVKDEHS